MPVAVMLVSQFLDGGGSERQLRQTVLALDRSRFEMHVAFFRPNAERERELNAAGVKTVFVPTNSFVSASALRAAFQLRRYLKKNKIQLLHAFDTSASAFAVPVARLAGVPVALASQRSNRALESKRLQSLRRIADPFAQGFIVNAKALADHLTKDVGIAPDRIRFCPNGLDTARFKPDGRMRLAQLERASVVIGCIAALRPEKHLPFFVDAFAEMRRQRPGLKLFLAGSGSETERITERIAANELGDDCLMLPHTPDTAALLRSIDIFVLASESEGASNSIMEAMACGCALVASNVEGTRDLVQDGKTGLLFAFGNQADLVAKVVGLVDDIAQRQKLAADASQWVRDNMSIQASAERMGAIYDEYLLTKGVIEAERTPRTNP